MAPAAHDQRVGIENIDHFVKEEPERIGLDAEKSLCTLGLRPPPDRERASPLPGCRSAGPVHVPDSGAGNKAAATPRWRSASRAPRDRPRARSCQTGVRPSMPSMLWCGIRTWPSSPPNPRRPRTTLPSTITPPPRPVPTIAENGSLGSARAEQNKMSPERARIAIVEIEHGPGKQALEALANIETAPVRMDKIGRPPLAENAGRARRSGRVETDHGYVVHGTANFRGGDCESIGYLPQADGGAFARAGGIFAESLNQKFLISVQKCIVDGGFPPNRSQRR